MGQSVELKFNNKKIYTVGETYIHIDIKYKHSVVDSLHYDLKNELPNIYKQFELSDVFKVDGFVLEFDEGSLKLKSKIMGGLFVLYIGIGQYGDFRNGVNQIVSDLQTISELTKEYLEENSDLIQGQNIIHYERRLGVTGRIQRSINKIDQLLDNRDNIPPNQFEEELENIKQYLANTLPLLNPQDENLILNNLPNDVRNNMPNPEIPKVNRLISRYALKPEDEFINIE